MHSRKRDRIAPTLLATRERLGTRPRTISISCTTATADCKRSLACVTANAAVFPVPGSSFNRTISAPDSVMDTESLRETKPYKASAHARVFHGKETTTKPHRDVSNTRIACPIGAKSQITVLWLPAREGISPRTRTPSEHTNMRQGSGYGSVDRAAKPSLQLEGSSHVPAPLHITTRCSASKNVLTNASSMLLVQHHLCKQGGHHVSERNHLYAPGGWWEQHFRCAQLRSDFQHG
jgi:hypothetical protein